jgi:hypothetical protein
MTMSEESPDPQNGQTSLAAKTERNFRIAVESNYGQMLDLNPLEGEWKENGATTSYRFGKVP